LVNKFKNSYLVLDKKIKIRCHIPTEEKFVDSDARLERVPNK
jgi:hypothetical protein